MDGNGLYGLVQGFFFWGGNSTGQHHIYMGKLTEMNMISGCDFASDESIDTEI